MVEANKEETSIIHFRGSNDPYFELSNFYPSQFLLDSKLWPTSEHYFQAQKSLSEKEQERIRCAKTPNEAKRLGKKVWLREDWEEIKIGIMEKACKAKFSQNEDLKKLLLSTGKAILIERADKDAFWGDGKDGKGQNNLGKILMKLREEFGK